MTPRPSFLLLTFVVAAFVVVVVESDEAWKGQPLGGHRRGGSAEVGSTGSGAILYQSDDDFHLWANAHSKRYASPDHRAAAERTWRANKAWAFASNARAAAGSHTLSVDGPFADLTYDEFVQKILSTSSSNFSALIEPQRRDAVPAIPPSVDWVAAGAVGSVFNQGKCGCCWAVAAVEAMEAIFKIQTGVFVEASVQQIIDCDDVGASGCDGGSFASAYQWAVSNGGLATAAAYPYMDAKGDTCLSKPGGGHGPGPGPGGDGGGGDGEKQSRAHAKAVNIDGYGAVAAGERHLLERVASQPAATAIEANRQIQLYHSGILIPMDDDCGTSVNHAVLVVGYDVSRKREPPYVRIKNSWGDGWGEKGFARFALLGDETGGTCGVATAATYPTRKGEKAPTLPPEPPTSPPKPPPGPFVPPPTCRFGGGGGGGDGGGRAEVSAWQMTRDCCVIDVAIGDGAPCVTWHALLFAAGLLLVGAAAGATAALQTSAARRMTAAAAAAAVVPGTPWVNSMAAAELRRRSRGGRSGGDGRDSPRRREGRTEGGGGSGEEGEEELEDEGEGEEKEETVVVREDDGLEAPLLPHGAPRGDA